MDVDKQSLVRCCRELQISRRVIKRDEGDNWCIIGKHGSITPYGRGADTGVYQLFVMLETRRQWEGAKYRLVEKGRMTLRLNADTEGTFLFTLPVSDEVAEDIREIISVRKAYSDATIEALRQRGQQSGWGKRS